MPFFSHLSDPTLEAVSRGLSEIKVDPHTIIQVQGEECRWVGFVLKGAVQVYRSDPDGREQVLQTLGPGMHFNAIPAIDGKSNLKASVRALTHVSLLTLPVDAYRDLMQSCADFASAATLDFSRRLDHLTCLVEDLSLRSVRSRLARFLLNEADRKGTPAEWTQEEIASRLGTVRDVIGRTLRSFTDDGLVHREGGRLMLLDREQLEKEAKI